MSLGGWIFHRVPFEQGRESQGQANTAQGSTVLKKELLPPEMGNELPVHGGMQAQAGSGEHKGAQVQ